MKFLRIAQVEETGQIPGEVTADYAVGYIEPVMDRIDAAIKNGEIMFQTEADKQSLQIWVDRCKDVISKSKASSLGS